MGKRIRVEFDLYVPDVPHSEEELEEWLKFHLGAKEGMSCSNPLSEHEPEAIFGTMEQYELHS